MCATQSRFVTPLELRFKMEPLTPGPGCYDLSLSQSLTPVDKYVLSLQWHGSDTCPQGCTVRRSCRTSGCNTLDLLKESAGYSTGQHVCELTPRRLGMSGTPPEVSHREGILLDVTMNRTPSPPPGPTQAFDVRRSHREPYSFEGGIVTLKAWQPRHTPPVS